MSDDKNDLVGMMNGAVPRNQPKWGHMAAGFGIGYLAGNEIKKLASLNQPTYYQSPGIYDQDPYQQLQYTYAAEPTRTGRAARFVWELVLLALGLAVLLGIGWVAWQVLS